jgi:hypothetical protein
VEGHLKICLVLPKNCWERRRLIDSSGELIDFPFGYACVITLFVLLHKVRVKLFLLAWCFLKRPHCEVKQFTGQREGYALQTTILMSGTHVIFVGTGTP